MNKLNKNTKKLPDGWSAEVFEGKLIIESPEGWVISWVPHPKGNSHQDIAGRLLVAMFTTNKDKRNETA